MTCSVFVDKPMHHKFFTIAGRVLLTITAFFFIISFFIIADKGFSGAFYGAMLLMVLFGLPGSAIYFLNRKAIEHIDFLTRFKGFLRSHDRFTVSDIAQKIQRSELETELLIAELNQSDDNIELVFHRPTREYIHRNRLRQDERIIDRCNSCGATFTGQVLTVTEKVLCEYCGSPLA